MKREKMTAPVTKNQEIQLEIQDLDAQGKGIGRYENFAVFVPGALPEETVRVRIVQVRSHCAYGKLLEVLKPSADRIEPECPRAGRCGGCQLAHLSYPGQLRYKQKKIQQVLERIGGFEGIEVPPILGMENDDWHGYRNKAQYPVQEIEGRAECGFYAPHSHRLIPTEQCLLQSETVNRLMPAIMQMVRAQGLSIYDETTQKGLLRHILIRCSAATGRASLCLILNGMQLPHRKEWIEFAKAQELAGLSVNYNREKGNVILGKQTETLYGSGYLEDQIGDLRFFISPPSFYQVNPKQTQRLYETALTMAGLTGEEVVVDAYCGIGTISLFLAQKAKKVYGIEIVPEAIEDARSNAAHNGITNAEFFCGKAEEVMPQLLREKGLRPQVIVVDPPRSGCEVALLDTILAMVPDRVVYVSCDPATLARDLNYLCHTHPQYRLAAVQGVCMFPQTAHVETVCQLVLRKPAVHINIDVDVEELVQDKRGAATYGQIKDYVLEHSGLKVSNLYIAQVKQKCGIIERENYNKPKSEDAKQPQCPPEKEKAIRAALQHFRLIE